MEFHVLYNSVVVKIIQVPMAIYVEEKNSNEMALELQKLKNTAEVSQILISLDIFKKINWYFLLAV